MTAPAVQAFRKAKRIELLERRRALDVDDRKRCAQALTERLLGAVDLRPFAVLGFYWPIRGELDLRGIARGHLEAGGTAGLPVVVAKNEPVEFWSWQPATAMQRGFWNIPVPHERRPWIAVETVAIRLESTDVRVVETTLVWVPTV